MLVDAPMAAGLLAQTPVTAQICAQNPSGSPWWHTGLAVAHQGHCPNWAQTHGAAGGELLVFKTEKPQTKASDGFWHRRGEPLLRLILSSTKRARAASYGPIRRSG